MERAAQKVIKKLKSSDDNDKFAALTFIPKIWASPQELMDSGYSKQVWDSLSSTHFLERAIISRGSMDIIFMILSIFSKFVSEQDIMLYIPHLTKNINNNEALVAIIDIFSYSNDVSPLFECIELTLEVLPKVNQILSKSKDCSMTPKVFCARKTLISQITGQASIPSREHVFRFLSHMITLTRGKFALFSDANSIDINPFMAFLRLAMIEMRLQLDTPINYIDIEKEIKKERDNMNNKDVVEDIEAHEEEEKESFVNIDFSHSIGPLINEGLFAASGSLLEHLVYVLIENEEYLDDNHVSDYFSTINSIISDVILLFQEVIPEREFKRNDFHYLLVIFAKWLNEGPFLCQNNEIIKALPTIINILLHFHDESSLLLPAFHTIITSVGSSAFNQTNITSLLDQFDSGESNDLENIICEIRSCLKK